MDKLQTMIKLIRLSLFGEGFVCDEPISEQELLELYNISKKHDLAHLLADALKKLNLLNDGMESKQIFMKELNTAVLRDSQQEYELQQISSLFWAKKIKFIALKGAVIKNLYPSTWMRTSCDIDVLVREEDIERTLFVLKESLGYKQTSMGDHDVSLFAPSGVHIELHYKLVTSNANEQEESFFENIWQYVLVDENNPKRLCTFTDEVFYCYHISHIAKHLRNGGCGVRAVLDTWLLNNIEHDKGKRDEILKQVGLISTANAMQKLANVWFNGESSDDISIRLGEYIFTGGVYGSLKNMVAAKRSKKRNKFTYLLSRIFLPYGQMKFRYPRLQKCPILYPYYVVKRFFLLLKKDTRKRVMFELNEVGNVDKKQHVENLLKDLDL